MIVDTKPSGEVEIISNRSMNECKRHWKRCYPNYALKKQHGHEPNGEPKPPFRLFLIEVAA